LNAAGPAMMVRLMLQHTVLMASWSEAYQALAIAGAVSKPLHHAVIHTAC
jgi:hypothetical protein